MKQKTIYVADDGTEFGNQDNCKAYEFCQKANKLNKHLQLWDENLNRLCTLNEDALENAYYIYADTSEARKFVNEYLDGLFEEIGWSATFIGYINNEWCDLEYLYNRVATIIANMEN